MPMESFPWGYYAVIESLSKIMALGEFQKARLTFGSILKDWAMINKWKPFPPYGAFIVQRDLDIPGIGGKDSMSGTFEDLNLPPSLISFAVVTEDAKILYLEFKNDSQVVVINLEIDENGLIDFEELKKNYTE